MTSAITRRKAVSAAMIASTMLAQGCATASGGGVTGRSRTYVLVHGGGHGGWCWERVATPLRAQGHRVYTPTMTGVGERVHLVNPTIDLDLHITDIVNVLRYENLTDVILVGHSYGGMVITGVADRAPERVGQLVYLDAAHPRNGEALWGEGSAMRNTARNVDGVELILFPTEAFVRTSLGVTDPADVAWVLDKCTPHPLRCFTQPLRLQNEAAVRAIPTTDIWRASILANLPAAYREQLAGIERVWSIDSPSHNLMITDAGETTDMLLRLAAL
jgi:pimeloyl-ACP methyl ester carboxylesterase